MTTWTTTCIDRLYERYLDHYKGVLRAVAKTNREFGSLNPDRCRLPRLSRSEFEATLTRPIDSVDVREKWIRRFVCGHEFEFPEIDFLVRRTAS